MSNLPPEQQQAPPNEQPSTVAPSDAPAPPQQQAPDQQAPVADPQSHDGVWTGVPVEVRRDATAGLYFFGVNIGGAFIAFGQRKLGGVDDDLKEAAYPGFQKQRAEADAQARGVPRS